MALINMAKREVCCKIVYYGIELSGKTTNLHYIHWANSPHYVSDAVSTNTETGRVLSFDLKSRVLSKREWYLREVLKYNIRFQLYTAPGQILSRQTRISTLKGADCAIFVADSQANKLQENIECWNELQEQLRYMNKDIANFPLVMQWNKRDLRDTLPISVLRKYLNPYHAPNYEAVAVKGIGVMECLETTIDSTLAILLSGILKR